MLGIDICAWALVAPETLPCPTLGCTLSQGIFESTFLWWIGLSVFAFIGLCEWSKKRKPCPKILALALILDCPLLVLMLIGTPCVPCLIIATLLFLLYLLCAYQVQYNKIVLCVWSMLYIAVIGLLINDIIKPYSLNTIQSPIARIYFSPSCSACRKLILGTPSKEALRIEWCPVAETSEDIYIIDLMYQSMQKNNDIHTALSESHNTSMENQKKENSLTYIFSHFYLYLRLWINASHVLSGGRNALPFIESYGIQYALKRHTPTKQHTPHGQNPDFLEPQINECTHSSNDCHETH